MENAHRQLVNELRVINRDFRQARKRANHAIEKLRVEIGPERWNQSYRIATFLAIKDAEILHTVGGSLYGEDEDDGLVELREEDFE